MMLIFHHSGEGQVANLLYPINNLNQNMHRIFLVQTDLDP